MLACAGRRDDLGAQVLGELDGEVADATAGRRGQHPLAGLDVGGVDQRLPGGQARERECRGVLVVEVAGLRAS